MLVRGLAGIRVWLLLGLQALWNLHAWLTAWLTTWLTVWRVFFLLVSTMDRLYQQFRKPSATAFILSVRVPVHFSAPSWLLTIARMLSWNAWRLLLKLRWILVHVRLLLLRLRWVLPRYFPLGLLVLSR